MNPIELKKFKEIFSTEKERIERLNSQSLGEFKIDRDQMRDDSDLTSFELEQSMRIRLRHRESLYLKKVNEALNRIKEGSFGSCLSCEEKIETKRLHARPTTTLCLGCKEAEEKVEKLHAHLQIPKSLGIQLRIIPA